MKCERIRPACHDRNFGDGESRLFLPPTRHGAQKKEEHDDRHESERTTGEKQCGCIMGMTQLRLHKSDQCQDETEAIADDRDDRRRLRRPTDRGRRHRPAQQPEPKKEKRRQAKLAQVIHASCLGDAVVPGKVCLQTLSAGRL